MVLFLAVDGYGLIVVQETMVSFPAQDLVVGSVVWC